MRKASQRSTNYRPFYPTTLGPNLHDITFNKLPVYSLRPQLDPIDKRVSPGPAAYPKNHELVGKKKHCRVSRTIYPPDKGNIFSMRKKGLVFKVVRNPGPAAYPFEEFYDKNPLEPLATIYPKDKGHIYSMRKKKDENFVTVGPGPAIYPRDQHEEIINSIHPRDLANKFSMVPRREEISKLKSPGPARYPTKTTGDISIMPTIYPSETQLPPTFKMVYNIRNRDKRPGPNAYPLVEGRHDPKRFKVDFMKKMIRTRRAPEYSLGIRHTSKQQYLVLPEDEY